MHIVLSGKYAFTRHDIWLTTRSIRVGMPNKSECLRWSLNISIAVSLIVKQATIINLLNCHLSGCKGLFTPHAATHHLKSFQWVKGSRGKVVSIAAVGPRCSCCPREHTQILPCSSEFTILIFWWQPPGGNQSSLRGQESRNSVFYAQTFSSFVKCTL